MVNVNASNNSAGWKNLDLAQAKLAELLRELVDHHGYGEIQVDVRIMRDGRKEVILDFGKHYRFVLTKQEIN
jgi:hypothetical protein